MLRNLKKIFLIVAMLVVSIGALAFSGVSEVKAETAGTTKIVIGSTKSVSSLPLYAADQAKLFTKNGIDVELKLYDTNAELNQAIANNEINGAVTDLVNYASFTKGSNWKIGSTMPGYNGLVANKKYKSIKSLKGKTIAVDKKDISGYYLKNLLKKNKMKLSDVKIKQVDSEATRVSDLKDKKVAAAVVSDPSISNAKANGAKILNKQSYKTDNGNVLVFSKDFLSKNVASTNSLYSVIKEAIRDINKQGYSAYDMVLSKYGISDKSVGILNNMSSMTMKKTHKVKSADFKSTFKYAKSKKLYKGKISLKKFDYSIKQVKK
ncbi:ABC transporter substrate-binding protein [Companilactobacillus jidongensis]|uniref:ABC transporter substrate-binding protein n=1 Tax=Companilactobacillus jidongensis TaxID=2486006 RepID=UPI000F795051|nr:ABC transporter substrate-binding protein [Companilactobacillus jidongensis]